MRQFTSQGKLKGILSQPLQILFVSLVASIALTCTAFAQQTTGNVRGIIKDPAGAVIANAKVTILDAKTNTSATTQSTGDGEYEFKNLLVGDYRLKVEASGFKTLNLNDVRVQLNQTTDVPVNLEIGVSSELVEISAGGAELIDTTTTNLSKGFGERQVVELAQTSVGSGIYNLALIAPNVSSSGGVGVGTGGAVGGQRPRNNNFVVDGIDNNDKSVTGPQVYISPESVAEFSLLSNQYQAEFAHSTGGQFITVTKSGTNEFHGAAYSFFRNRHLNALDTLQKLAGVTRCTTLGNDSCMPRDDYGRFGFNVGGPMYLPRFGSGGPSLINGKNRFFFFTGYERLQTGSASGSGAISTPTAAGMAALSSISGLSATNLAIFKQYVPVAPSQRGTDTITVSGVKIPIGDVSVPSPNFSYNHYFTLNFDFTQSEKTQHHSRFTYNKNRTIDTAASLPQFFLLTPFDTRLFSYTLNHTFTNNLTNETRLAFRRSVSITPAGDFKFPGLDRFPNIGLIDLGLDIGPDGNAPQFGIENNYQIVNNLSYLAGNHSLKFGVDARKLISPQSFVQRERGDYQYVSTDLFLRDISPDFLGERTVGSSAYYGDQILLFAFAQDDWRVRPNFTLNLGINYSYQELPRGARAQVINKLSSVPGVLEFNEPKPQLKNFAPRVGFAYSPNFDSGILGKLVGNGGRTSIRAGFSMAYDVIFDNLYILSLPPQSNQTVDVETGIPNFLKNGGIPPTPIAIGTDAAAARAATSAWIPDQQVPYSLTYTMSFQRQFAQSWSFEARYLGTRGIHLLTQNRINVQPRITDTSFLPTYLSRPTQSQIDALPLTLANIQARSRFVPKFANAGFNSNNVIGFLSNGNSSYNGLSTQLTHRLTKGWQMSAAYTWSHLIDDTTAEVFSTVLSPRRVQDFQNLRAERSNSALDRRQRFVLSSLYDIPFFSKSSNHFVRAVLGGFSLAGTLTFEAGEDMTILSGADANQNGDAAADRTIINLGGDKKAGSTVTALLKTCTSFKDDGTCAQSAASRTVGYVADNPNAYYIQAKAGARATAGRNTYRLPGINNLDFSIFKNFALTETAKIQVRADLFNAFNHAQYVPGSVNGVEATGTTGALNINTIGANSAQFLQAGRVFSSHPRIIQLALRLNF